MENKNEKLGAVYLKVDGLNKERFKELKELKETLKKLLK